MVTKLGAYTCVRENFPVPSSNATNEVNLIGFHKVLPQMQEWPSSTTVVF